MEIKRKQRNRYLSRTLLLLVLGSYIAIVLFLAVLDIYVIQNQKKSSLNDKIGKLETEVTDLEYAMTHLQDYLYERWVYDENFAAMASYTSDKNMIEHRYELMKELENNLSVYTDVGAFYVFYTGRESAAYVSDSKQIPADEAAQLRTLLLAYTRSVSPAARQFFLMNSDRNQYAVIGYTKDNATIYGVLCTDLRKEKYLSALPEKSEVVLVSEEMENKENQEHSVWAYQDNPAGTGTFVQRSGGTEILKKRVKNTDFIYAVRIPERFADYFGIQQIAVTILFAVSILFAFILIRYLQREVIMPLRNLGDRMEKIGKGEESKADHNTSVLKEFDDINRTFDIMIENLENQKIATYEETMEKQKAMIQYLQLQLKPHFYLNGLKTVSALALSDDPDRLQDYLQRFSGHIRYLLSLEREEVPLEQELEFTDNYVRLQSEMSGRTIEYSVYIDREDPGFMVPVLSVQAFVENSIKYAKLGNADAILEIHVEILHLSSEEGDYLDIAIHDNGQGYSEEVLEKLNGRPISDSENIGVNNLKRRCQILYGDRVTMIFSTDEGAVSEIIIPKLAKRM